MSFLLHCGLQKWGVTHKIVLTAGNATFVALQVAREIASCNSPESSGSSAAVGRGHWENEIYHARNSGVPVLLRG